MAWETFEGKDAVEDPMMGNTMVQDGTAAAGRTTFAGFASIDSLISPSQQFTVPRFLAEQQQDDLAHGQQLMAQRQQVGTT